MKFESDENGTIFDALEKRLADSLGLDDFGRHNPASVSKRQRKVCVVRFSADFKLCR